MGGGRSALDGIKRPEKSIIKTFCSFRMGAT